MKIILFLLFLVVLNIKVEIRDESGGGVEEDSDLCSLCVDTLTNTLQALLDIILDVGVIGSCGVLCQLLPVPGIVIEACTILCDVVGIEAFVALIKKADLDPIWMCQEMKICPINDCTESVCAQMLVCDARPPIAPKYSTEKFIFDVQVLNATGTSSVELSIKCPEGSDPESIGSFQVLYDGLKAEKYSFDYELELDAGSDLWPGVFDLQFVLCQGQCNSKHEHSRILAHCTTSFNWTWDEHY